MNRMRIGYALATAATLVLAAGCQSGAAVRPRAQAPTSSPATSATGARLTDGSACPLNIDAIDSKDTARAYAATLAFEKASAAQLQERSVLPADRATDRGGEVTNVCGAVVAHRTFVVEARRTDVGLSESLAQSVTYVSHRGDTWFVWSQPH